MATLQQIYDLMQPRNTVLGRVLAAALKVAWAVLVEDETTTNHANRLALAGVIIENPDQIQAELWRLFLGDSTVQDHHDDLTQLTDTEIETAVQDHFDTLADMEASS